MISERCTKVVIFDHSITSSGCRLRSCHLISMAKYIVLKGRTKNLRTLVRLFMRSIPYSTILLASLREIAYAKFCPNEADRRSEFKSSSRFWFFLRHQKECRNEEIKKNWHVYFFTMPNAALYCLFFRLSLSFVFEIICSVNFLIVDRFSGALPVRALHWSSLILLCKALHKFFRCLKTDLDIRPIHHQ